MKCARSRNCPRLPPPTPTLCAGLGELDHRPEPAAVNSPAFDRASSASSPTPSDIARLLASDADDDDDDELADGYSGAAADDVMAAVVDAQSDEDEYRTLLRKATERVAERVRELVVLNCG